MVPAWPLLFVCLASQGPLSAPRLDAEQCVKVALHRSGQVQEALGQYHAQQARLETVESSLYPKLTAMSLLAPAYTVRGGGLSPNTVVRYQSIRDWGPFASFEGRFVQPISSFGRFNAGRRAASERVLVEQGRVREVEQRLAREVRHLYYTHLYVGSLVPALAQARVFVDQAVLQAERLSQAGSGEVHQGDLGRLIHGRSELLRRIDELEEGRALTLLGLKQTMGLDDGDDLQLVDDRLPIPSDPLLLQAENASDARARSAKEGSLGRAGPLAAQLTLAANNRPEWQQIVHGQRAAIALERSERAAMLPRLLFVGQFAAAWTPTREHDRNPWHYDIYNRLAGGAALVLQLDLDVAQARAKAREAAALGEQVRGLERFAETGIPTQVRQAFEGLHRARGDLAASRADVIASRRWFAFAKAALLGGTGEARDLMDGLVAYLQARQAYLQSALNWWTKLADLTHATGAEAPPFAELPG